ncbi:MAG: hypothetical protein HY842_05460 [Bacteroidetes bacterium]|nr:hypothetical protein [Bacteroidota bacterium]
MDTIHSFKATGIASEEIDFAAFAGKKIMVVNVASECGHTPHQQLQELYEEFGNKLAIVGFPANDFGGQEPGANQEIQAQHPAIQRHLSARSEGGRGHPPGLPMAHTKGAQWCPRQPGHLEFSKAPPRRTGPPRPLHPDFR